MNIVTRGSLYYSVSILTSNKEHNLNFVLFLSESLSGKLNSSKAIEHSHIQSVILIRSSE